MLGLDEVKRGEELLSRTFPSGVHLPFDVSLEQHLEETER